MLNHCPSLISLKNTQKHRKWHYGVKRGLNFCFFEKNRKIKCCRAGGLNPDLPGGSLV